MIEEDLARYGYTLRYSDLNDDTIEQVKKHFLDALGCAIAARASPPVKAIRKTFKLDTFLPLNAFLYGSMIRYLDYNDTYLSREPAHPSDNFGAVLAAAEATKAKPKAFICAAAAAYEIQCRLCDAASLRKYGWDHVVYGSVSSAVATGKLLHLNEQQLQQALSISLSTNISTRQVRESAEISMWKASAFANVARNGTFAAMLAKNGMTGPNHIFQGEYGMMNQLTDKFKLDTGNFGQFKSHFKIEDCWLKKWPAEIHSQSAIEAAIKIREQIKNPMDIKKITIETHEAGYTIIGRGHEKWNPETRETADHSLPFIVAAALYRGDVNKNCFTPRVFKNKKLLKLVHRVTVKENPKLTAKYPNAAANKVKVRLKGFKTLEAEVMHQKGHSKNKMTRTEVEQKFKMLTKSALSPRQQKKVIHDVWGMDHHKSFNWRILRSVL